MKTYVLIRIITFGEVKKPHIIIRALLYGFTSNYLKIIIIIILLFYFFVRLKNLILEIDTRLKIALFFEKT